LAYSVAYVVKNERLSLDIAIVDINSLHKHEATISKLLDQLTHKMKQDGCLRDPIIVDKKSLVVLDGVHRITALQKLGIERVPACLVDYKNPNIKVFSWHRTISNGSVIDILSKVRQTGVELKETADFNDSALGTPPTAAAIRTRTQNYLVTSGSRSLKKDFDLIVCIEEALRNAGFGVKYETESDAHKELQQRHIAAVLCTPRLTKRQILETGLSGKVLAHKTSRHILPARPMALNVPLSLLRNRGKSISEVNAELKQMLQKRNLRRIPPGSLINGRRYEEELYLFED
jgi:hypothetical protein